MPCNYPRPAWKVADKVVRHASLGTRYLRPGKGLTLKPRDGDGLHRWLRCGQCLGCRLDWAADWALRCEKEAKCWPSNSFVTLTYSDSELPIGSTTRSTVSKREFQLFMKRLRKELGEGIRFFASGEYGDANDRAHYHALLFNCSFPDRVLWRTSRGNPLFRSPLLERLWPFGFSTIGDVNFQTANYVARYVVKKLRGAIAQTQYADREPPFVLMSRRPGIGAAWFERNRRDLLPSGTVVYGESKLRPAPRFFVDRLSPEERMELLTHRTQQIASRQLNPTPRAHPHIVGDRRETNLRARLNLSGRPL